MLRAVEFHDSSRLKSMLYSDGLLTVVFRDRAVWEYHDPHREMFNALAVAESPGAVFNKTYRAFGGRKVS